MKRLLLALTAAAATITGSHAAESVPAPAQWPMHHFAWGAEISSAIDMTEQDLSTLNLHAAFGYKNRSIQTLGAGAGIDIAVGNNTHRFYPVYAIIRTTFSPTRTRCFLEARAGYSFNRMTDGSDLDGVYASAAWGVNLAMGRNYRSYLSIGYTYRRLDGQKYSDLHAITAAIGISF